MTTKQDLRRQLKAARREHVAGLPESIRALVFHRPPAPMLQLIPDSATVGLYHATPGEAPTGSYARFLFEHGHPLALPRFADRLAPMTFAAYADPFSDSDLDHGPFDILQPPADADELVPEVLLVPLVGFTASGTRLGQGGGHYDRWLAAHPQTIAIGLAWDCQLVDHLPAEQHDRSLNAVVTPTRLYGPFA